MAKLTSQYVVPPSGLVQDNSTLDELRRKHAQAVSRHDDAKDRLVDMSSRSFHRLDSPSTVLSTKDVTVAVSRQRHLEDYLENLRLQRRYRNLQTLAHHSEHAEKIASEEDVLDGFESVTRVNTRVKDSDQLVALTSTQRHLESLVAIARTKTTDLELAVVKARQQLRLEQSLLERAKGQSKKGWDGETAGRTTYANRHAMEATRDALQRWIGEGLAKCEQDIAPLSGMENSDLSISNLKQSDEDNNTLVEIEYERYLDARTQLVHIANTLRTPLPDPELTSSMPDWKPQPEQKAVPDDQKQKLSLQRAPHLRQKSRASVIKVGEQSSGPDLAKIESVHLPRYHHERLLNTHATHLNVQTTTQDSRLLQSLGLLSHESHLLPTFPLSTPDDVRGNSPSGLSQDQAEIEYLLRSWAFASETADDVLRENVMKNAEDTKEALDRASQYLEETQIVEGMRQEVATSKK